MNTKKYPVQITLPIISTTHDGFELARFGLMGEKLNISKDRNTYNVNLETEVTEDNIEKHIWKIIDSLCVALSITQPGVFSRAVYYGKGGGLAGIKWLGDSPPSAAATGVSVMDINLFDTSKMSEAESVFDKLLNKIDNDSTLKAVMIAYTVSCRFFNLDIIRESAINFFTVAEIVASQTLPRTLSDKSTYQLKDLQKAGKQLGIENELIENSYKVRGELAHGHEKHLLLMEHSLGEHEISSYSLKLPALECKKIADSFVLGYINNIKI